MPPAASCAALIRSSSPWDTAPLLRPTSTTVANSRRRTNPAGRSDDSSFQARRIPAINFFTGFHGDYHRPGDDWEKIDAEGTPDEAYDKLAFNIRTRAYFEALRRGLINQDELEKAGADLEKWLERDRKKFASEQGGKA